MLERVTLGGFVVDTEAREVRRDGEPVHLSPKAFELLPMHA
jgi:DNA-binding winged helix-turn-helix (wHTH) protein